MNMFRRKQQKLETLPALIAANERIASSHSNDGGQVAWLVVDGTAESAASRKRLGLCLILSLVAVITGGIFLNKALATEMAASGGFSFLVMVFFFGLLVWASVCFSKDTRIFTVNTDSLFVKLRDGTSEYEMTQIVGVQLHQVDQQRIDAERRERRHQSDPKLIEPYSMDLTLETSLGGVDLGSVYGIKNAQEVANSINMALQFMKGRTGTGEGTVTDPAYQYRGKTAGQIPA